MATASTDDFDGFSRQYDQLMNASVRFAGAEADYYTQYKVDCVLRSEAGHDLTRLLDLGCGVGNASDRFAVARPELEIDGVDVSIESVGQAQLRQIARAQFRAYDGATLPFAADTFDVAFIAVVLHHVPIAARAGLVAEVLRTLKPGGRLYVFEHNPMNPVTRKVVRDCPFDEHAILLPPGECSALLRIAGFKAVEVRYRLFVPPMPALRWLLPIEQGLEWLPLGGQYYVRGVKPMR